MDDTQPWTSPHGSNLYWRYIYTTAGNSAGWVNPSTFAAGDRSRKCSICHRVDTVPEGTPCPEDYCGGVYS